MLSREEILASVAASREGLTPEVDLLHIMVTVSLDIRDLLSAQDERLKTRDGKLDVKMEEYSNLMKGAFDSLGVSRRYMDAEAAKGKVPDGLSDIVYIPDPPMDPLAYFTAVRVGSAPPEFAALRIYISEGFVSGARHAIETTQGPGEPQRSEVIVIHDDGGVDGGEAVRLTFEEFLTRVFTPSSANRFVGG